MIISIFPYFITHLNRNVLLIHKLDINDVKVTNIEYPFQHVTYVCISLLFLNLHVQTTTEHYYSH